MRRNEGQKLDTGVLRADSGGAEAQTPSITELMLWPTHFMASYTHTHTFFNLYVPRPKMTHLCKITPTVVLCVSMAVFQMPPTP